MRAATSADAPAIWDLIGALARYERLEHELDGSAERLASHLGAEPPPILGFLAERDGSPVGYALAYPTYSSFHTAPKMWLEDLFVLPAERGTGTGRALFEAVARLAASRGCRRLSWEVLDWNEPAVRFYEHLGARRDQGGWLVYHLREGLERLARPA